MQDEELARLRLRRQHLTGTPLPTPEAVVGWLGAVQAQDFAAAKWSIAQRTRGRVTSADLDRALAERRILRTHVFRSTWHLVLPADLRWMLMLIGPRVRARMTSYYLRNGLTDAVFARSQAVLREALAGGAQLVRREVAAALARGRVATDGLRLRFLLLQAELDGIVCSGALRGEHQTFALVDDLVPRASPIPEHEALAELARRYFSSHGPATVKDFIWWSSLTAARARQALELLKGEGLRRWEAGGRTLWMLESRARRATDETSLHLLPAFDEYIIGYTESRDAIAVAGLPDAPRRAPMPSNVLVRDGQVNGSWRTTFDAEGVRVDLRLARPLEPSTQRALEHELERYGRFLELPVQFATPTAQRRRRTRERPS